MFLYMPWTIGENLLLLKQLLTFLSLSIQQNWTKALYWRDLHSVLLCHKHGLLRCVLPHLLEVPPTKATSLHRLRTLPILFQFGWANRRPFWLTLCWDEGPPYPPRENKASFILLDTWSGMRYSQGLMMFHASWISVFFCQLQLDFKLNLVITN